ncbi:fungal-specific transcription factor domain-containing protein [Mycena haematopus]|nr:fungal-specific transcription factor domain-containing protein [Mycena haematopus]
MFAEMDSKSSKLRRIQGACDVCKKRKSDGGQVPGNRCTHCKTLGLDCTHVDLTKALSSANGYVTALESRVEKMERLLTEGRIATGIDFAEHLENENEVEPLLRHQVETLPRNDEELADGLNKLKLNPENHRFFGKSSGIQFVQTAFNFQAHLAGMAFSQMRRKMSSLKRDEFWELSPWQLPFPEEAPRYSFPEPDLLATLMGKYFAEVNIFWPVLHRHTFEHKVTDKLHLRDHRFGSTLLMVCSLGARYSEDPRVLLEGVSGQPLHYAGWKWHSQVRVIPKHLVYKPDLYELQTVALSALYLRALSPTALCWTQVGFGLRRAQDVGAHRRRNQEHPTVENEHWKRVFWVLLCLEWVSGTHTGRPLTMHYSDFDQDLPVECDDEYLNFKQPKDKPSDLSYFICYAKLLQIQADAATTLYSPRKPRDLCGRSFPPTEAQCIMAFDSALNAWLNSVPEHLRWDPERQNILHFKQSALLHAAYYNVQILVHRPFIPAPFQASPPGAVPSLAIASNAARLLVGIFDVYERRGIMPHYPNLLPVAFAAGIVLLLSAWSGKKSSFTYNPSKELDQFHSCIKLMMAAEKSDLMNRLLCAGGSLDRLFSNATTWPRGYETFVPAKLLDADLASQWSSTFSHNHLGDFEAAADQIDATLYSRFRIPEYQYLENGQDEVHTDIDDTFTHVTQMPELDFPMNLDMSLFPADIAANADVMAMWSTAPSGFHVDEWSYIMSQDMSSPQFNQFSAVASETNPSSQMYLCTFT